MMRIDKLTLKAQEALSAAQERAAAHDHQQVEPLHLLAALVAQKDGVVPPLLGKLGVRAEAVDAEIERELSRMPKVTGTAEQYLSKASNEVLKRSFDEAAQFKDEYVSTEHLLLALTAGRREAAAQLLERHQVTREALFREGYDPAYGARPLRRAIQQLVQDPLALEILEGKILPGEQVLVDRDKRSGALTFKDAASAARAAS